MFDTDLGPNPNRRVRSLCGAGLVAVTLGLLVAGCDGDDSVWDGTPRAGGDRAAGQAPAVQPAADPPDAAPGAAPSSSRETGTWFIISAPSGARTQGDRTEGTTYRFAEAGKVTVAGTKQCAYRIEAATLTIDCDGVLMTGAITFPDAETMVWIVAGKERLTLKKR